MNNKKYFIITLSIVSISIFVAMASLFLYKEIKSKKDIADTAEQKSEYMNVGELKNNQVDFLINGGGPVSDKRNVVTSQGREVSILIRVRAIQSINPDDIKIGVVGVNETDPKVNQRDYVKQYRSSERLFNYEAKYTPENDGIDVVNVTVGNISFSSKIVVYSAAFLIPSSLELDQVSFGMNDFLKVEKKEKTDQKLRGVAWFDPDLPGSVTYTFSDAKNSDGDVSLTIYTVSPSVENFQSLPYVKEITDIPPYIENFLKLKEVISSYPNISKNSIPKLDFPPVNAACVGPNRSQFISSNGITGIRFMVYGCYQGVSVAEPPIYIFQGVTNDGKYHIVFRYDKMISPKLKNYKPNITKVTLESQEKISEESFNLLASEKDNDFQPSLKQLDDFVRSIKLNY